jgi:hydroxyacylglutathione hydrolase
MFFQHVYDKSLAQASYFIGCQKEGVAIVIDPKRDVDTYLDIARQNQMKITHVTETHIHADFLSGSRELAALTGAELYLSDEGGEGWQYEFPNHKLKDGDVIKVGNLSLEVLHTPGHTPESISFLLTDHPASPNPVMIFTGDFVFVGDVGRPDLLEKAAGIQGTANEGALQMYKSINRFAALPDYIQVWPGHGAGSACGKALGAVPSTTVGYEKLRNWAMQYGNDQAGFVKYLLEDQPEAPRYFAMMKKLNKSPRTLLTEVPKHKKLSAADLKLAIERNIKIIDARHKNDFAKGYIPGSINIQGNNAFATWAGWFLNYDEDFILIADESKIEDLTRKLMRIGLDNIAGYFSDLDEWTGSGGTLQHVELIDYHKLTAMMDSSEIVDVRGTSEYNALHIPGAKHVFLGTITENLDKIDRTKPVILQCQGGDRSSIAYSILAKHGYRNIMNYAGGMNEWIKQNSLVA